MWLIIYFSVSLSHRRSAQLLLHPLSLLLQISSDGFSSVLIHTLPLQQYMLFPVVVGVVSVTMSWENRGHRTCVLDGNLTEYTCAKDAHSVMTGRFHNVYIRLKAQKHGEETEMFFLSRWQCFHDCNSITALVS